MSVVKNILRPAARLYRKALGIGPVRRILSSNYSTGLVALGERNTYRIPTNWVTVDWGEADFVVDFSELKPLPFADASQRVVYSAHLIEHVSQEVLEHLISESFRVLRSGGYLRLEAPDAERIVSAYNSHDAGFLGQLSFGSLVESGMSPEYGEDHITLIGSLSNYISKDCHVPVLATRAEVDEKLGNLNLEDFGRWCTSLQTEEQRRSGGHVNAIYFSKLESLLRRAGFASVDRMQNRHSRIPGIKIARIERTHRAFYSLYVEARK